jgi:hypothetical protein
MKKLLTLLLIIFSFLSCTNNDNETDSEVNPNLLQKVIFNQNTPSEKHWNFNENGLLSEITKEDGTLLQNFVYDTNERLSNSTIYNTNGTIENFSFTYNVNGSISSLNNVPLNFDTTLNAYYFGDLNANYSVFKLNTEGLLTYGKSVYLEDVGNGTSYPNILSEVYVNYADDNLKGYSFHNGSFNSFGHDSKRNPLRNATIAVFKAFAITQYNENWLNTFAISNNNVTKKNYPFEDFIREEYDYTFNSNDLPITATLNFYSQNTLDFSTLKTLYYYQGDVIP